MTNPNDPAFAGELMFSPSALEEARKRGPSLGGPFETCGLTKREYFAAMALCVVDWRSELRAKGLEIIAKEAIAIADALIAELNKEAKPCPTRQPLAM
jgi:hypothetical protein